MALAFNMVGYNGTSQLPHDFVTPVGQLWSSPPLGIQLWNETRVLALLAFLCDHKVKFAAPVKLVPLTCSEAILAGKLPGLGLDTFNVEIPNAACELHRR